RAEENLRRAEGNEKLSLRALEEIFDNLARREVFPSFAPRPGAPPQAPFGPLRLFDSEEDAALLQSVLNFYDQFAEQNATNAKLRGEAAGAQRRVGDIQGRLGQFEKAEGAYRRAAAMLEALSGELPSDPEIRLEWAETYTLFEGRPRGAGEFAAAE